MKFLTLYSCTYVCLNVFIIIWRPTMQSRKGHHCELRHATSTSEENSPCNDSVLLPQGIIPRLLWVSMGSWRKTVHIWKWNYWYNFHLLFPIVEFFPFVWSKSKRKLNEKEQGWLGSGKKFVLSISNFILISPKVISWSLKIGLASWN